MNRSALVLYSFLASLVMEPRARGNPAQTSLPCELSASELYKEQHQRVLEPRGPFQELKYDEPAGNGSNKAQWYRDSANKRWLVKEDTRYIELQTGAEVVSSTIYRYLGFEVSESVISSVGGKRVVATKSLGEGLRESTLESPGELSGNKYFRQLRYFSAYLKDWDRLRVGPNNFNLGNGRFAMFDFGGSLGSRAQGEHKPGTPVSSALGSIESDVSFDQIVRGFRVDWLPKQHPWRQELTIGDARDLLRKFSYLSDPVLGKIVALAKYSSSKDTQMLQQILSKRRDAMIQGLKEFIVAHKADEH